MLLDLFYFLCESLSKCLLTLPKFKKKKSRKNCGNDWANTGEEFLVKTMMGGK